MKDGKLYADETNAIFFCVLIYMLALQTAYGLTFLPDFRFTLVTHLSNFFEFRPFFTPLGMIYVGQQI